MQLTKEYDYERRMAMMNMFMGEYNHTMDTKGRLIVPSKFRDLLGEEFVVTKGLDKCLFVFTEDKWNSVIENIDTLPITKSKARQFSRFLIGGATTCEIDKQGRILIPQNLREYAMLDKDAVLVGVGNRIEIWNKEACNAANDYDEIEELAEDLDELRF